MAEIGWLCLVLVSVKVKGEGMFEDFRGNPSLLLRGVSVAFPDSSFEEKVMKRKRS